MYYEIAKNDHGLPYDPLKGCVVPRPIGWISTISKAGMVNLRAVQLLQHPELRSALPGVLGRRQRQGQGRQGHRGQCRGDRRIRLQPRHLGAARAGHQVGADRRARRRRDGCRRAGAAAVAAGAAAAGGRRAGPLRVPLLARPCSCPAAARARRIRSCSARCSPFTSTTTSSRPTGLVDVLKMRPIARLGYKDYCSIESIFQMEKATPEEALTPRQAAE